ncbi:hypothetical protein [Actinoplanes sp. NPDC048796]|uniref:hypothetical protein n=1 Tax=unclassified Actinoplanes TaxID=2626549 RepID=UPI0033C99624
MNVIGPHPLCPKCRTANGGLVAVRHRQVHLRAHGREACVDHGIAGVLAALWTVSETRSCCQNDGGRAYVVPTAETHDAAVEALTTLGLAPEPEDGFVFFRARTSDRLDDVAHVRHRLEHPTSTQTIWRVNSAGRFERSYSAEPASPDGS